jgi:hypothetical protein
MTWNMSWLRRAFVVALFAAPLAACQQGEGERCQVQSDCATPLLCVLPPGGSPQTGGFCQQPGSQGDAGATVDMEGTQDLSALPDLSTQD